MKRDTITPPMRVIQPSVLYFGTPVVLVSTRNSDGSSNLTPISSAWALGDRLVLGMGISGLGCENLLRQRECVINIPSAEQWPAIEAIGRTTGRQPVPDFKQAMGYRGEADKFACAGLTALPSDTVQAARVAQCPLQIEAKLLAAHAMQAPADADQSHAVYILETQVSRVHAHEAIMQGDSQRIDTARWHPLVYVFRHYFGTGEKLGENFRAGN
ncbi:flavin reductase family protein [Chitinimonas sp.]|uniref:flavin reductase family protein n=1 Tax=Chitinimonas sp. TaxID=1934313 RepID=UPI0035B3ABD4